MRSNLKFCTQTAMVALLLGSSGVAAQAQNAQGATESLETIVVTGIRASLESAQAIKQSADTFVDSITSEDIGALPDQSVTETLARIPGVSINRFAGSKDPDHFSAEGSGIVIQGLTYAKSTLNGRDTFSANNGRALDFAAVPPELLVGVDVYKNQSSDLIEGGLAGTVNLRTRVPFDAPGLLIAGSASANYTDFRDRWEPSGSALISDRWQTKIGEVGLLFNGVVSKLDSRADGAQASNFACRKDLGAYLATGSTQANCPASVGGGQGVWFPRGASLRTDNYERTRLGAGAAAQWQSNDGTMLLTLQYLNSSEMNNLEEHYVEIATDAVSDHNSDSVPVAGTKFTTNGDGIFQSGVITDQLTGGTATGWIADTNAHSWLNGTNCYGGGCDPRTPNWGMKSNNTNRAWIQHFRTDDFSANFKWTPNETWAFNADFQHVYSSTNVADVSVGAATYENTSLDISGGFPVLKYLPPSSNGSISGQQCTSFVYPVTTPGVFPQPIPCTTYMTGGHTSFSDPYNNDWRYVMDHFEHSRATEDAAKIDVDFHVPGGGWLQLIRAGVRWSDRDQTISYTAWHWKNLSDQYGGNGPIWMDNAATPAGSYAPFAFDDFFQGRESVPTPQPLLFYNGNPARNYAKVVAFGTQIGSAWRALGNVCDSAGEQYWIPNSQRCNAVGGSPYTPGEISPLKEITNSAYVMAKFGGDVGGHTLSGNVGLRYFETKHTTSGVYNFLGVSLPGEVAGQCLPDPASPTPPSQYVPPVFCNLPVATKANFRTFVGGAVNAPVTEKTTYSYFLPSLNLKYDINEDMLLRFGVSKGITPPSMGFTRFYLQTSVGTQIGTTWGGLTARGGNPSLRPTRATMFDLSYEWYFAKVGSLTVSTFYKELHDVVTNWTGSLNYTNNGATVPITTTIPVNAAKVGTVKGFEFAYQRFFDFLPAPFDGLGVNANYSFIESRGVPQSTLNASDPQVGAGNQANVDTSKLPLEGLSKHNTNLELLYAKGPIETRIAYNWRSRFLLTTRDEIVPYAPITNEATGQLDGSLFYSINDHLKLGVEAVNILDTMVKTSQVLNVEGGKLLTAPRSAFLTDRRITLTVRANF